MAKKQQAAIEIDPQQEEIEQQYKTMTGSQRAAVIMLLLGEQHAANIIKYLERKELLIKELNHYNPYLKKAYKIIETSKGTSISIEDIQDKLNEKEKVGLLPIF